MAFVRKTFRGNRPPGKSALAYSDSSALLRWPGSSALLRWVAIPGVGVALSLWLAASLAGAYSAGNSLSSTTFMPRAPRNLAVGATVGQEKAARLIHVAIAGSTGSAHSAKISSAERYHMAVSRAALSPQKLAAAFAASGMAVARHESPAAPLKERFEVTVAADQQHPAPARFGQRSETERSSRLALALAGSTSVELAYAAVSAPSRDAPFASLFVSPEGMLDTGDDGDVAVFDDLPDDIPLPSRRPKVDNGSADKPDRTPASRVVQAPKKPASPRPAGRDRDKGALLAYAKPDTTDDSGGFLSGLFSRSTPRGRAGVAVYDISAATVTMPDGTVLEAHSGIGDMADNARYADEKMRGPTPPGTYKLTMREALFHGVEAIRMTPVSGNTFGRTGFLAHTELLRGRPEQSHGCVAFKNYKHFLKAFKKGHITQMVVKG